MITLAEYAKKKKMNYSYLRRKVAKQSKEGRVKLEGAKSVKKFGNSWMILMQEK